MITELKLFENRKIRKKEIVKFFLEMKLEKFIDRHYSIPFNINDGIKINIIGISNISIFLLSQIYNKINEIISEYDIEIIKKQNNYFIYFNDCDWDKLEIDMDLKKFNI